MGGKEALAGVAPANDSIAASCGYNVDYVQLASALLKCSGAAKTKYGDSGCARMTSSNSIYTLILPSGA
jgi:hypothetical protein